MSDTFDDLFGSSDDEQQIPTTTKSVTEAAVLLSNTTTATKTSTAMDDLFPDDDEEDEIQVKSAKYAMSDEEDDHQLGKTTSTTTTEESQQQEQLQQSQQPQQTKSSQAMGQPEHFYVQRDSPNRTTLEKEFTLLTIPKVVGVDYTPYDPLTFDHKKVLESLPPFQREYTLGIESMIRWKIVKDPVTGEEREVSNSRVIHWENGDIHLQIGRQYFPLSIKNERISLEESVDYLFIQSNGLYFHVGNIVSSWKTSIAPHKLSEYGPRMNAVKSRLIELDKERRTQLSLESQGVKATDMNNNDNNTTNNSTTTKTKKDTKSNNYDDDDDDE